jgi:hypothetical protein
MLLFFRSQVFDASLPPYSSNDLYPPFFWAPPGHLTTYLNTEYGVYTHARSMPGFIQISSGTGDDVKGTVSQDF